MSEDGGFLASMLTQEQAVQIRVMARKGEGIREIAMQLGCSRNTVRRYLREQTTSRYGPRAPRASKLHAYEPYLREPSSRPARGGFAASVLLRELAERDYKGGISQLRAWLVPLKQSGAGAGRSLRDAAGQAVEADFTAAPHLYSPARRACPVDQ